MRIIRQASRERSKQLSQDRRRQAWNGLGGMSRRRSPAAEIEAMASLNKLAARRAAALPTGPRGLVASFCGIVASRDVLSYLAGRRAALEKERRYAHALARPRGRRPARREAAQEATGLWRAAAALAAAEERRRVERELEASRQEPRPQHRRPLGSGANAEEGAVMQLSERQRRRRSRRSRRSQPSCHAWTRRRRSPKRAKQQPARQQN